MRLYDRNNKSLNIRLVRDYKCDLKSFCTGKAESVEVKRKYVVTFLYDHIATLSKIYSIDSKEFLRFFFVLYLC